jgi:P pilus assembly chaperone PapD
MEDHRLEKLAEHSLSSQLSIATSEEVHRFWRPESLQKAKKDADLSDTARSEELTVSNSAYFVRTN